MKNFLLIYNSTAEAKAAWLNLTPEQIEAGMKPWFDWNTKCGDLMLDLGAPTMPGSTVDTSGNVNPTKSNLGGYSVIKAENMEGAMALCENHPHLSHHPGCTMDVYQCANM